MSLNTPSRRLLQSAASTLPPTGSASTSTRAVLALQHLSISSPSHSSSRLPLIQRRNAWFNFGRKKSAPSDEVESVAKDLLPANHRLKLYQQVKGGRIQSDSIFSDEVEQAEKKPESDGPDSGGQIEGGINRSKDVLARALDPDPRSRVRWERKMVIRHVTKATDPFSREPRAARIRRTEREFHGKSPFLGTSVKKLVHLSRQIAGKTVEAALVQMRYSKKKMAKEVAYQLELARDRAIVERGMGLGNAKVQSEDAAAVEKGGERAEVLKESRKDVEQIKTKDGKWVQIDDPTKLYVAQSWVERGPLRGIRPYPRARGRIDAWRKPSTSISVLLKEQKTLIREHKEREEKKYRQGPWVHLPDRPITAQRQHYSW